MTGAFHPLKNLPGCMMPDGGECCAGYTALADDWHKLREAMKGAAIISTTAGALLKAKDAKIETMSDLLRIIARGVEIGQSGRRRQLSLGDAMNLARDYCDANGLSYAQKDLRPVEREGFLIVAKELGT